MEKPRLLMRGLTGGATEIAWATLAYNLKRALAVLGAQQMRQQLAQVKTRTPLGHRARN